MEWTAPAIVLHARAFGEHDLVVTVLAETHGLARGLARGGGASRRRACWQAGNIIQARWRARLADQLGHLDGELVQPVAALVMHDALRLGVLASCCALAEQALPERESCDSVMGGLLRVLASLGADDPVSPAIRWEVALLAALGYGLDLSRCAVSGGVAGLRFVSPRSGRAVSEVEAGPWRDRLLALPSFLLSDDAKAVAPPDWRDGLRMTGHFLARDVFGQRHHPIPAARRMLYDQIEKRAGL